MCREELWWRHYLRRLPSLEPSFLLSDFRVILAILNGAVHFSYESPGYYVIFWFPLFWKSEFWSYVGRTRTSYQGYYCFFFRLLIRVWSHSLLQSSHEQIQHLFYVNFWTDMDPNQPVSAMECCLLWDSGILHWGITKRQLSFSKRNCGVVLFSYVNVVWLCWVALFCLCWISYAWMVAECLITEVESTPHPAKTATRIDHHLGYSSSPRRIRCAWHPADLKFNQPSEPIAHTKIRNSYLKHFFASSIQNGMLEKPVWLGIESILEQNQQEADMLELDPDYPLTRWGP